MNNIIRQHVRLELSKRNMSQSQLAAEIGVSRQYLSNIMRGVSGNVPGVWEKIFVALELELIVQPHDVPEAAFKRPDNVPEAAFKRPDNVPEAAFKRPDNVPEAAFKRPDKNPLDES